MIRLLLMQIFLIVENSCKANNKISVPQQKQLLLRNFRRLIDQHYLSIRLPKEYADLLYVTPNHLNALSRDLLGKTAGEVDKRSDIIRSEEISYKRRYDHHRNRL